VAPRCHEERPLLRMLDERLVACHFSEKFLDGAPLVRADVPSAAIAMATNP
jgi:dipeptide transport system ATP-binding protein